MFGSDSPQSAQPISTVISQKLAIHEKAMGNDTSRPMGVEDDHGGVGMQSPRSPGESLTPRTPSGRRFSSTPSTPKGSSAATSSSSSSRDLNRSIQRMDKMIRKRVRGGITYNMKIVIRGAKGTGKTSLFKRLKGEPIPESHVHTSQIEVANIGWHSRQNLEENVKCEVWDVADRVATTGSLNGAKGEDGGFSTTSNDAGTPPASGSLPNDASSSSGSPAATSSATTLSHLQTAGSDTTINGTHLVANVDSSTVDVYHETHGVILVLDITKWHTLEYVRQQLDQVPVHIPTLVVGNFRDCGNQRKIFKEDITELLYGSDRVKVARRPQELLYFECSFLNCYGLKALHKYFGIPFLQLKLATLRQQMRLLEGEFAHLKHDLQASISKQRYTDYIEHIRTTGSDIRTGKRAAVAATATAASTTTMTSTTTSMAKTTPVLPSPSAPSTTTITPPREDIKSPEDTEQDPDAVVTAAAAAATATARANPRHEEVKRAGDNDEWSREQETNGTSDPAPVKSTAAPLAQLGKESTSMEPDMGDLPERHANDVLLMQQMPLKIVHTDTQPSLTSGQDKPQETTTIEVTIKSSPAPSSSSSSSLDKVASASVAQQKPDKTMSKTKKPRSKSIDKSTPTKSKATSRLESIEDFQVKGDSLDHFYSSDDDSGEDDEDQDVVIPAARAMIWSGKKLHKQKFLYSDDEESDEEDELEVPARPTAKEEESESKTPPATKPLALQEKSALEKHIEAKMEQECLTLRNQTSRTSSSHHPASASEQSAHEDTQVEQEVRKANEEEEEEEEEETQRVSMTIAQPTQEESMVAAPAATAPVTRCDEEAIHDEQVEEEEEDPPFMDSVEWTDRSEDQQEDESTALEDLTVVSQTRTDAVVAVAASTASAEDLESFSPLTEEEQDDDNTDEFVVPLEDQHVLDESDNASDQDESVSEPEPSEPSEPPEPQQSSPQPQPHQPAYQKDVGRDTTWNQLQPKSSSFMPSTGGSGGPKASTPAHNLSQSDHHTKPIATTGMDALSGFHQPRDLLDDFFSEEEEEEEDQAQVDNDGMMAASGPDDEQEAEDDEDDRFARIQVPKKSKKERRKHKIDFLMMEQQVSQQSHQHQHQHQQQHDEHSSGSAAFAYDASVLEAIERARQDALANYFPAPNANANTNDMERRDRTQADQDDATTTTTKTKKQKKKNKKTQKSTSKTSSRAVVE